MRKQFIAIFIGLSVSTTVFPEVALANAQPARDVPTFKLNVIESRYLPPAMYGTWSITAIVIKSNAPPNLYNPSGNELWTLDKTNGQITLKNIVNNAAATVTVDNVDGNTATFHHEAQDPAGRIKIKETPTVTVKGNRLFGVNKQQVTFYKRKKPVAVFNVDIQLEGTRLANSQKRFRDPENSPTQFEIAPLEFEE